MLKRLGALGIGRRWDRTRRRQRRQSLVSSSAERCLVASLRESVFVFDLEIDDRSVGGEAASADEAERSGTNFCVPASFDSMLFCCLALDAERNDGHHAVKVWTERASSNGGTGRRRREATKRGQIQQETNIAGHYSET